jgi:translation initiation factor 2B subunit (eIF-2B alpha/beta/delta family)
MGLKVDYYGLIGWYLLEFEHKKIDRKTCLKKILEELKKESDLKQEMLDALEDNVNSLQLLHEFIHDDLQEVIPEEIIITTTSSMHVTTNLIHKAKES